MGRKKKVLDVVGDNPEQAKADFRAAYISLLQELSPEEVIYHWQDSDGEVKRAQERVDMCKAEMLKRLKEAGFQRGMSYMRDDGYGAEYTSKKTPTKIDRALLVLEDVDPDLIDRCTTGGEDGEPYVQLVRP